jgi:rhodanese-related sulfurtransferase
MEIIDFLFAPDQLLITGTLAILIGLFFASIINDKFKKYQVIGVNGAINLMDSNDLIILDVREDKERKSGYIENDMHIPLKQVKAKLSTIDNSKNILVYCRSGSRSGHIAGLLCNNNFEKVFSLQGGLQAWEKANLPIKKV